MKVGVGVGPASYGVTPAGSELPLAPAAVWSTECKELKQTHDGATAYSRPGREEARATKFILIWWAWACRFLVHESVKMSGQAYRQRAKSAWCKATVGWFAPVEVKWTEIWWRQKHKLTKLSILHVCLTAHGIFIMFMTYTCVSNLVFTSVCKL